MKERTLTNGEVETLKQAQKKVDLMNKGFQFYAIADIGLSVFMLKRSYGNNSHILAKMTQKTILFLTLRMFFVYEIVSYFSM